MALAPLINTFWNSSCYGTACIRGLYQPSQCGAIREALTREQGSSSANLPGCQQGACSRGREVPHSRIESPHSTGMRARRLVLVALVRLPCSQRCDAPAFQENLHSKISKVPDGGRTKRKRVAAAAATLVCLCK